MEHAQACGGRGRRHRRPGDFCRQAKRRAQPGLPGQNQPECLGGGRDAAPDEIPAKPFERPLHPLVGGFFRQGDPLGDFGIRLSFEETQQDRFAIARIQVEHHLIQHRENLLLIGGGGRFDRIVPHGGGGPLPQLSAALGPQRLGNLEMRRGIKPSRQAGMAEKDAGFLGQQDKNDLRDILRQIHVPTELPERAIIDQAQVTLHQLREGGLRPNLAVLPEQMGIIGHCLSIIMAADPKIRPEIGSN